MNKLIAVTIILCVAVPSMFIQIILLHQRINQLEVNQYATYRVDSLQTNILTNREKGYRFSITTEQDIEISYDPLFDEQYTFELREGETYLRNIRDEKLVEFFIRVDSGK